MMIQFTMSKQGHALGKSPGRSRTTATRENLMTETIQMSGGCYCGNITFDAAFTRAAGSFQPRMCDCGFCSKHGAAWVSDPDGLLRLHAKDAALVNRYKQGSESADFLVCMGCGVLVAVCCEIGGSRHAAINRQAIDGPGEFGDASPVSPQRLDKDARVRRWQDIWFRDVTINQP